MKNQKISQWGLLHALGVIAYVALVTGFMSNGKKLFGNKPPEMLIGMAMLLLFVVSATITGGLVLGKPAMLYLNGEKRDALQMLFATVGWLIVLTLAVFLALILVG